jgi:hypothetical protein
MSDWTTRVLPEYTRPYGVEEVHDVWFVPNGWPGKGPAVSLIVPECELQFVAIGSDGEPVTLINSPQVNKNVRRWLRYACKIATAHRACLFVACDTADEAERAAKRATKWLPNHQRSALGPSCSARTRPGALPPTYSVSSRACALAGASRSTCPCRLRFGFGN